MVIIFSLLKDVTVRNGSKQEANLWLHQWQKRLIFCFFQIVNPLVHSWNLSAHLGNQILKMFAWQAFACLVLNREVTNLFHFFPFRTVLSTKTLISYSWEFKKSSLWSSIIMQQNTHHGSQDLKESPNSLKLKLVNSINDQESNTFLKNRGWWRIRSMEYLG